MSLLATNKIPTGSVDDLPAINDVWVRVLFLFGLDEIEQNLLVEEADAKSLEELCQVLALPEVKMIRRADDAMQAKEQPLVTEETGRGKRKRKSKNYAKMAAGTEAEEILPDLAPPTPAKRSRAVKKEQESLAEEDSLLQTDFKEEDHDYGLLDDSVADASADATVEATVDDDLAWADDDELPVKI